MMTDTLSIFGQAALDYAARGWAVFPVLPDSKEPLISARMGGKGFMDATTDLAKIRRWWSATPNANIGLSLVHSGLVAVDVDAYKPECEWAAYVRGRDMPDTLVQRSARGGIHYIFTAPQDADFPGTICKAVDVKHRGYILLEPSTFDGGAYQFENDDDPVPAPDWLLRAAPPPRQAAPAFTLRRPDATEVDSERVRAYCDSAIGQELQRVRTAPSGMRNNTLNAAAFTIGQIVGAGYASISDVFQPLMDAALECGLAEKEASQTIGSGLNSGQQTPRTFPMDDDPPFDAEEMENICRAIFAAFDRRDAVEARAIAEEVISRVDAALETAVTSDPGQRSASRLASRGASTRSRPKPVEPTTEEEFRDAFPKSAPMFPVQDYERDLTGLLREVTQMIDESANMRSEQGAFGAALACLGTVMGRMVEVKETGLRTNIYVVGTAESGAGKSSAMGAMAKMMARCGVDDRLAGSDFTSGSAILKEISGGPAKLFSIDEFGDVIRRVLAPRAASHERDIGRILKDMYSAASGFYRGKAYATQDRQDIAEPHLCIYGVSTHEAFWESIDGRSFSDGLLARFVMIPIGATETQTPSDMRGRMVSDMVTDMLASCKGAGNLGHTACQAVGFDRGIWDRWMGDRALFQRHSDRAARMKLPGAPSIIQRICENGMKIAMISAMGRHPINPVISDEDYALGIDVAHWSAIYMISAIDRYYVENSNHRDMNRIAEYIDGAGPGGRTKTEIARAFQGIFANSMAAKSIMEAIVAAELAVEMKVATTGRAKVILVGQRHVKAVLEGQEKGA